MLCQRTCLSAILSAVAGRAKASGPFHGKGCGATAENRRFRLNGTFAPLTFNPPPLNCVSKAICAQSINFCAISLYSMDWQSLLVAAQGYESRKNRFPAGSGLVTALLTTVPV